MMKTVLENAFVWKIHHEPSKVMALGTYFKYKKFTNQVEKTKMEKKSTKGKKSKKN